MDVQNEEYYQEAMGSNADLAICQTPKTQQVTQSVDVGDVPRGHSYFPGNDEANVKNEQLSLEQVRYMQRMAKNKVM